MAKNLRNITGDGSNSIYEKLKKAIVSFDIMPGEALSENQLAALYGTSRTTIRPALMRLEEDHLVHIIPQKGTFVSYLDYNYIVSVMFIRLQTEYEILRRLTLHMPDDVKQAFEKCIEDQRTKECTDSNTYFELDSEFHSIVFSSIGLPDIGKTILELDATCRRYRLLNYRTQRKTSNDLYVAHSTLFGKMLEGNPDEVFSCFKEQIYGNVSALEKALGDDWDKYFLFRPDQRILEI